MIVFFTLHCKNGDLQDEVTILNDAGTVQVVTVTASVIVSSPCEFGITCFIKGYATDPFLEKCLLNERTNFQLSSIGRKATT